MHNNGGKNHSKVAPNERSDSKNNGVQPAVLHSSNGDAGNSAKVLVRTSNLHNIHPVDSNKSSLADRAMDEDRDRDKTSNSKASNSNPNNTNRRCAKDKADPTSKVVISSNSTLRDSHSSKVVISNNSVLRGRRSLRVGVNSLQSNYRLSNANRFKRCGDRFFSVMTAMAMGASQSRNEKPLNAH